MSETDVHPASAATTPFTVHLALLTAVLVALDGPTFPAFAARSLMQLGLATAAVYAGVLIGLVISELSASRVDRLVVVGLSLYGVASVVMLVDNTSVITSTRFVQGVGLGVAALASLEVLNLPGARRAARLKTRSSLIALLAVAGPIGASAAAGIGPWQLGPLTLAGVTLAAVVAWLVANSGWRSARQSAQFPGRVRRRFASRQSVALGLSAFTGSAVPSFLLIGALTDELPLGSHLWTLAAACLIPVMGIVSALVSKPLHLDFLALGTQLKLASSGWLIAFACLLLASVRTMPSTALLITACIIIGFCSYIHVTGILIHLAPDSNASYSLLAKQLGTHAGNLAGVTAASVLLPRLGYFVTLIAIGVVATAVLCLQSVDRKSSRS